MIKAFFSLTFILLSTALLGACSQSGDNNIVQWEPEQKCNLHQEECSATHENSLVSLKISPHPIPIARPLGIEVSTKNVQVDKMELDISGVNMYMGYNRVTLSEQQPGRFVGTSMLAFCTSQKMLWQITLIIHQSNGSQIQIPYELETINRP